MKSPAQPTHPDAGSTPGSPTSRRGFLTRTALLAATAAATVPPALLTHARAAETDAAIAVSPKILDLKTITPEPHLYAGWPTLARRRNSELWVAWSGGRESHVCPFGQVVAMTSRDGGESWTWPRVLLDSAIDDRDAGITETARGTLLVTTFTSLAYESSLTAAERSGQWPAPRLARWQAAHRRTTPDARQRELGQWMLRSTDGGITWSARYPCEPNSPHGPTQLRDGRLLYAGKELWTGQRRTGFWESSDDGLTWRFLASLPVRPSDSAEDYHELHAVECTDGRLVAHIRNENKTDNNETLQSESTDGGRTWSIPSRPRITDGTQGIWGLPSHLLRLADGRLLMTYGHRRKPLGNQARVSTDHGRTWSTPLTISSDATHGDLGYPSTVELDDGTLVTVWYEVLASSPNAVLRQARWKLP
jgi:sialidase-1